MITAGRGEGKPWVCPFVRDGFGELILVSANGTSKYVWGSGLAYATSTSGIVLGVYHADGLGSVRALTDAGGNVIQTYQTDEFWVPTQTQGTSVQPFQFTGQQRDSTALYSLRIGIYDWGGGPERTGKHLRSWARSAMPRSPPSTRSGVSRRRSPFDTNRHGDILAWHLRAKLVVQPTDR